MSAFNFAKNATKSFFSPVTRGYDFSVNGGNPSKLLFFGAPTIAGATIGGINGLNDDTSEIQAAVGGIIGSAALPAVGAAASVGYHAINNYDKIGKGLYKGSKAVGKAGAGFFQGLAKSMRTGSTGGVLGDTVANVKNPIGNLTRIASKFTGNLIKEVPNYENGKRIGNKLKTTGLGKAVLGVTALSLGISGAMSSYNESRMGTFDGNITRATSDLSSYMANSKVGSSYSNNGGATGDLVFALNANRRG